MGCPYANILGVPGQGVHAARIFGFSWNDTWMTVAAALATSFLFNITWWKSLIAWFVVGELLHVLFGVNSTFTKMLGINQQCIS
jgi:hypothetical protein